MSTTHIPVPITCPDWCTVDPAEHAAYAWGTDGHLIHIHEKETIVPAPENPDVLPPGLRPRESSVRLTSPTNAQGEPIELSLIHLENDMEYTTEQAARVGAEMVRLAAIAGAVAGAETDTSKKSAESADGTSGASEPDPYEAPVKPCRDWCVEANGHPGEHSDDRWCFTSMTQHPMSRTIAFSWSRNLWTLDAWTAYLARDHDRSPAYIVVAVGDDGAEMQLTVDEAKILQAKLAELIELGDRDAVT